jgi:hypothetical protein
MDIDQKEIREFVEQNIGDFHQKRLLGLSGFKLENVLKRKNPYLYKAKNVITAGEIVKAILDAHLSSQEETVFGDFLEKLAIYINEKVYKGRKSAAAGIDLEFEKDGIYYIVSIKSGPNWANSSQIEKMKFEFRTAKKVLGTNSNMRNVVAVNGCCYGKDNNPDKGEYLKLCGQRFWEFISGDDDLYTDIIEPLGFEAKARNEEFNLQYTQIINRFTQEFLENYTQDGIIDWQKIVKLNSGR